MSSKNKHQPESILVVIPVHNEQGSIGTVVSQVRAGYGLDVVVVDDASTDGSIAEARAAGAMVMPLCANLGAWSAMQTGMRYARAMQYSHVLTMDGDGQHDWREIDKLIEAMQKTGSDVVIGACTSRGSSLRHWAWNLFRRLTGAGIEDLTSGFRLYNRRAFWQLSGAHATLLDYQDVGVILQLQSAGLRISEVDVSMTERCNGKSRVYYSWLAVVYYMMLTTVLSLSKGRPSRIRRYAAQH